MSVVENPIIGTGWSLPISPRRLVSGEEKIRQSIWIILSTAPGERPMLPDFGCDIHALVFAPNSEQVHGRVAVVVRESLTRWEPRIDVLDVRVERPDDARNQMLISINYRVRANNAVFNLVYPLFLTEGAGGGGRRVA